MKKIAAIVLMAVSVAMMLLSCGKDSPNNPGSSVLDMTVVGDWEGFMTAIIIPGKMKFNGAEIFVNIYGTDSSFSLVTLDTTKNTIANPAIGDTTLVLDGHWRINSASDSILLTCDTGRIIDTALNVLSPRNVKGQIIPMLINISKNAKNGDIEWQVALADLVPLAPFLGMDLTGFDPSLLQVLKILLVKKRQ